MTLHPSVAAVRLPVRSALSDLAPGDTVAVACSGGADSLALASATVFEARRPGLRVVGVTVADAPAKCSSPVPVTPMVPPSV